ncbi:hypothetical protein K1T71_007977 [Dendrolimus kikuchii]|uniref:Uncharacterized protein n=1 Tax=Dendrolimus kikuchii TaxID=765133 RepID=A0ACC1CYQ9_9NEOP|nr:hypothetical protein K1T71_007977 [Dendrolimus kikuchii]
MFDIVSGARLTNKREKKNIKCILKSTVFLWPCDNAQLEIKTSLLPVKGVLNALPEFLLHPATESTTVETEAPTTEMDDYQLNSLSELALESNQIENDNDSEEPYYPVQYASLPPGLAAVPLPLENSDHELMLNVSWQPSLGVPATDYSIEVRSLTETVDCLTPMCYDYNIPGNTLWWVIPAFANPVVETCAVRPGCSYRVQLIAHPWDGHTAATLDVNLNECTAGVCSCAHAPRLPQPVVKAKTVIVMGLIFVNITWTLPTPQYPQRLPPGLKKKSYTVSIAKQMVSNAHPAPWYANTVSRKVDVNGTVSEGDSQRWLLLPITDQNGKKVQQRPQSLILIVRFLARVNLVDERGCIGPAGNATAYDPAESDENKAVPIATYVLWATFGGACVLAMVAILAVSARIVKKVLNAFRPNTASAPLEPLRHRPAWFPLQLRK